MTKKSDTKVAAESTIVECGIIMPISSIDDCDEKHCADVLGILKEAASSAGFEPVPVWIDDASEIIHKKIIENVYRTPIAICDVSGHNPNVMFELGLRLAFDKPTLIVVDNHTKIIFDIGGLKHYVYRRDLRLGETRDFIASISKELKTKHEESLKPNYQSFLKTLGTFHIVAPDTEISGPDEVILDRLASIERQLTSLRNASVHRIGHPRSRPPLPVRRFEIYLMTEDDIAENILLEVTSRYPNIDFYIEDNGDKLHKLKFEAAVDLGEKLKNEIFQYLDKKNIDYAPF